MDFYSEVGARPFINAGGWGYTRYGGSIMPPEVLAAMGEASKRFVNLYELQDRVGAAIATMTNNEAAMVCCGAASGMLLSLAACIAGTDPQIAERLPDTQGLRNEVIMSWHARGTETDPAIRAAGGKIVHVGEGGGPATFGRFASAITNRTAAIVLVAFESEPELEAAPIVKAAHERGVPVIVDGAYAIPPKENLWRYTRELGVDAFVTSGGKAMRGPQTTGLVLGKREIVAGCKFHASPNLRIGRGMKVGKEEFAGVYMALKLFLATDFEAQKREELRKLQTIADAISEIPGIRVRLVEQNRIEIKIDEGVHEFTSEAAAKMLLAGEPSILISGRDDKLSVRASQLQDGEEEVVASALRRLFGK
jgi:L-seryl-tRNA(Ser) seleniumtransferase